MMSRNGRISTFGNSPGPTNTPTVNKNVAVEPDHLVRWVFGGFWRGVGEVRVTEQDGVTVVEGFEFITPRGLWLLAAPVEDRFMASEFERIRALGWQRLRKNESDSPGQDCI